MDKSKKGKKSRQEKSMDDDSVGDVEERKPARNSTGKTNNDRQEEIDAEESDSEWKQPSKLAKNTAGGKNKKQPANSDEESGDSDNEKKVTAKQSKSNTKKKNKKESREEEVIKETPKADVNDVKSNQKKDKKGAAKNALKKKQEASDEDDDDDDDEVIVTKKGAQMKPTFQMLAMESSEDEKEDEEDSDASIEVKKPETVNQKKGKKAKQDKKKVKPAEDEDIDKLVAEISNMSQKKKGDKKKEQAVKEETSDNHVIEAKPEVAITGDMTQEELYKLMDEMAVDDDDDTKVRKKKGKQQVTAKKQESVEHEEGKEGGSNQEDDGDDTSTVKSAAQKKKEKKERQKAEKQKKTEVKGKEKAPAAKEEKDDTVKAHESKKEELEKEQDEKVADKKNELMNEGETEDQPAEEHSKELGEAEEAKGSKKDKKKKKDDKDKDKDKAKKPSKMVQEILERQKRLKEEEERLQREEEERSRKEEEAIRLKEEEERRIKERKEKEKQKKKEKIERKKLEGTFLTEKQKADKRRLAQMLEVYQKDIPDEARAAATEKKPPRYEKKKPKQNRQVSVEGKDNGSAVTSPIDDTQVEPSLTEAEKPEAEKPEAEKPESAESKEEETDEVKDAWDISSAEEEEDEEEEEAENKAVEKSADKKDASVKETAKREERSKSEELASEEEEKTSEEEEDSDESEESSSEDDDRTPQEKAREKALARIQKRKDEAEAKRTVDRLRAPVVCVLGHVDTGKTKILDKLRRTNVQDGEAGGITQQIGATNVPQETIREQTKMCKEFQKQELKLPGLLIIDTPGHESFSNLRNRGSSLCDIAILVVDIMHGLEPQTIESMNLLKSRKTPFVVALNKVDRLYGWQTNPHSDIINTLNRQKPNTKMEFNDRTKEVIVQFAEQGLNATLFHENKNPREYISLVPTSAHTGDGMGSLIALLCDLTQNMLAKRLMFSEELKATVMEVKALPGLGTTIDVILVNGTIHEGDTIVVAGQEGPIVTQIRALLMPQPLRELRVKSQYEHHKEVLAAQGCKIIAKDLEKALAGLPLYVAPEPDEAEIYKEELSQMLKDVLGDVKVSDKGVYVQASTLGSLEALLQFLKTSEIPFAGINIGPVHRKDIMKASVMLEHDQQYAVILAFDVKVEHEAQTMADSLGVRIFTADIIYHLFDSFTKYREDFKKQKREEFKHIAVFPCKMRIMPQYIFNSRDPIVVGVIIEAGFLKEGTLLCVPSKEFVEIGRVSSIEVNHKTVERATKGQEVCIKIDPIPGEAPKMYGRHFEATDSLVSKISRQSIDAVKNYFREEMSKNDWQLIMELKKIFEIL